MNPIEFFVFGIFVYGCLAGLVLSLFISLIILIIFKKNKKRS